MKRGRGGGQWEAKMPHYCATEPITRNTAGAAPSENGVCEFFPPPPPEPLHVLRPLAGRSELPHRNNPVASSRHARGELEVRPAITTIALRAE